MGRVGADPDVPRRVQPAGRLADLPATDLKVTGNTWQVVSGGPADCGAGKAVSIESILLPKQKSKTQARSTRHRAGRSRRHRPVRGAARHPAAQQARPGPRPAAVAPRAPSLTARRPAREATRQLSSVFSPRLWWCSPPSATSSRVDDARRCPLHRPDRLHPTALRKVVDHDHHPSPRRSSMSPLQSLPAAPCWPPEQRRTPRRSRRGSRAAGRSQRASPTRTRPAACSSSTPPAPDHRRKHQRPDRGVRRGHGTPCTPVTPRPRCTATCRRTAWRLARGAARCWPGRAPTRQAAAPARCRRTLPVVTTRDTRLHHRRPGRGLPEHRRLQRRLRRAVPAPTVHDTAA